MSEKHLRLTHERLLHLLSYDPASGAFAWKNPSARRVKVGGVAGTPDGHGYIQIQLDGVIHKAHRLAWFYVTGEYPSAEIDHRDGNRSNNAWANLRLATSRLNRQNIRRPRSDASLRTIGVQRDGRRFRAKIQVDGRQIYLGRFDSEEAAGQAYLNAKRHLHDYCEI